MIFLQSRRNIRVGAVLLALALSPAFAEEAPVKTFPSYRAAISSRSSPRVRLTRRATG